MVNGNTNSFHLGRPRERKGGEEAETLAGQVRSCGIIRHISGFAARIGCAAMTEGPTIMIAANARDASFAQNRDELVREKATIDEIADTNDRIATKALDLLQCSLERMNVGVKIRDKGDSHGRPHLLIAP